MKIIYCCDPLNQKKPDPVYDGEVSAATENGLGHQIIDFEALVNENDVAKAVRRIPQSSVMELGLYRGWMLKPSFYATLYEALKSRGVQLINTPEAYRHCHYLPESYEIIRSRTPKTVWVRTNTTVPIGDLMRLLEPFGSNAIVVKDFVKSRKHEWQEACFISSASDAQAVEKVVKRFLQLQGSDLNEGLVFREFVELEPLTTHSRSGMPLTCEFRTFFIDGELLYSSVYWEEGEYGSEKAPDEMFTEIAKSVRSRFFTLDVAKKRDGSWVIIELGDGQVAGLPDRAEPREFYKHLAHRKPTLLDASAQI